MMRTIWEYTPESAHPTGRKILMAPFYWDFGDDDSPLGNDTGASTFQDYLHFREQQTSSTVAVFIAKQLSERGLSYAFLEGDTSESQAARMVDQVVADDFIIGLAFSQIMTEGKIDADVRRWALAAVAREQKGDVLDHRGGSNHAARLNQLDEIRSVLEVA